MIPKSRRLKKQMKRENRKPQWIHNQLIMESSPEKPNPQNEQPAEEQNAAETEPEITETRRFVVCPKCGEKIWL